MGLREMAFPSLPCYPVKGQSQGLLHGHSVGQTQALGSREFSKCAGRVQNCSSGETLSLQRGIWGFTDAAEGAGVSRTCIHIQLLWGRHVLPSRMEPACRTKNPALFSSHDLGSCLGKSICSILLSAQC